MPPESAIRNPQSAMQNPFAVHAMLTAQSQAIAGGQTPSLDPNATPQAGGRLSAAVLIVLGTKIPCTISPVLKDFSIVPGGRSQKTFIESCIFLFADGPNDPKNAGQKIELGKATPCTLIVGPGPGAAMPIELLIWEGGLMPGGYQWRFSLVDRNFEA